ncbi:hypothetical protein FRB96_001504 [Tulasnella sp. 330]|nr:hypothetical protein FRB96_001504 [Tulasnella sp. 330]KAG8890681.1 hypothetical protein FRB98_006185 [Tulasnella sp. 332]
MASNNVPSTPSKLRYSSSPSAMQFISLNDPQQSMDPSKDEQHDEIANRRPTLTRPRSITIEKAQEPRIDLESGPSPNPSTLMSLVQPDQSNRSAKTPMANGNHPHPPKKSGLPPSPCFVHSLLDKGVSLTDWLQATQEDRGAETGYSNDDQRPTSPIMHQPRTSSQSQMPSPSTTDSMHSLGISSEYDDDDDNAGNLTRQLAATAVGVREMSKQLGTFIPSAFTTPLVTNAHNFVSGRARVKSNIQNIMVITKARDNRLIKLTRDVAVYIMSKQKGENGRTMVVYVDAQLKHSKRFDAAGLEHEYPEFFVPQPRRAYSMSSSDSGSTTDGGGTSRSRDEGQLRYWTSDMCSQSPHLFDFVVTLGGDGTVLFTSWLFQSIVPPVLSFALGSLGFLTNFDFTDHQHVLDNVLEKGIRVNLRMRFTCTVYRALKRGEEAKHGCKQSKAMKKGDTGEIWMRTMEEGGWEAVEGNSQPSPSLHPNKPKDREIMCYTTKPCESFEVLNDLVVDRGPSPYMSLLELFGDEYHMTTVQADGLTISTPTGSTAYSLSAGGSLVHPEIPSILITPICPHTLSFRPMLLPDSMELRICVPYNSRSTAWASFDGRGRVELRQGDHIKITASKFPFPTVCADSQSSDWFKSISRTLKWNERERQKSFVVVEEGPDGEAKPKRRKYRSRKVDSTPNAANRVPVEGDKTEDADKGNEEEDGAMDEEDEVDDEEEEKFDIDDSSAEAAKNVDAAQRLAARGSSSFDVPSTDHRRGSDEAHWNQLGSSDSLSDSHGLTSLAHRAAAILGGTAKRPESPTSGIETPGRYIGGSDPPVGHAPHHHVHSAQHYLRHGHYDGMGGADPQSPSSAPTVALNSPDPRTPRPQDSHLAPRPLSVKKTAKESKPSHRRGRSMGDPAAASRRTAAFAVYGQDESDSNTSD